MSSSFAERVVAEAEAVWQENPHPKVVAEANGWGWHYGRKGFKWCGHTAGMILRRLGVNPELCKKTLASTARLADKGPDESRWSDHGYSRPAVATRDMQPGDIVVIVTGEDKSYGDHITICTGVDIDAGTFTTIEGNAIGLTSSGAWKKGVVKRTRDLSAVRQVLRITEEHTA